VGAWDEHEAGLRLSDESDCEVKGLALDTMRRYLIERYGEPGWGSLVATLPQGTRALIAEVEINEWYPEAELRRLVTAIHAQLAEGDDQRFREIIRALALGGINRVFRALLGLSSARFVLEKVPVIWTRLRRGPSVVTVDATDDTRVLIHYEDFRYCGDPIYRQFSIANCQALVVAAKQAVPKAKVVIWDDDSMTLSFELPGRSGDSDSARVRP